MIASRMMAVEGPVEQEGGIQYRPDHMVQMPGKDVCTIQMGIQENGKAVVVLERTTKGSGIDTGADHQEQEWDKPRTLEGPFHGVLILHRILER
jgi:hypothetical protein